MGTAIITNLKRLSGKHAKLFYSLNIYIYILNLKLDLFLKGIHYLRLQIIVLNVN